MAGGRGEMEEAGGIRRRVVEEVAWEGGGRGRSLENRECKKHKTILRFMFPPAQEAHRAASRA